MKEVVTSHGTGRWLLLGLCLSIAPVMAQSDVRGYPDPGHRWLGVYAGGPERHFDYFLRKISLGDTFPDKAAWWEALKKATSTQGRHDGPLQLKIPPAELAGLKEFDVHVLLSSNSGVEQGDKACATLRRFRIDAR